MSCNNILLSGEKTICTVCRHELPKTNSFKCKENPTAKIFYGRVKIERADSFLWYKKNSIVQQLIHNLKYKGFEEIGAFLGDWYGNELSKSKHYQNIDLVIPVPLHSKKLKQRKYNQVTEFGKCIATKLNTNYSEDILIQNKKTSTQTNKNRESRWDEKRNAYTVNENMDFNNMHLLIVDDVITTGSTLEACIKTLKKYQNCKVSVVTMAITA